jgi:RNA recognition motif-containing protein
VKIYVDNLSDKVTEEDLERLLGEYGVVENIELDIHQFGNRSKGYAYLDMPNDEEALAMMKALYGSQFMGQTIRINQARSGPHDRRGSGRGGGRRVTDPPAI